MADPKQAIAITLINEDGITGKDFYQSPQEAIKCGDPGGETVHGISRKNFPMWDGWKIVDSFKNISGFPSVLLINDTLNALVQDFYVSEFWNHIRGNDINAQVIANQVFDSAVNQGVGDAGELIQNAVNSVDNCLKVDGRIGPLTISALNRVCYAQGGASKVLSRFLELREARYQALAARLKDEGSQEALDLPVWLARCKVTDVANA